MRAATANILHTLTADQAERALDLTLRDQPEIVGLQEWDHPTLLRGKGYQATRTGGLPILVHRDWGKLVTGRTLTLAGRRGDVRPTRATEAVILDDEGDTHVVLNVHLVAHHDQPANMAAWHEGVESVEEWIEGWKGYRRWVTGDVNKDEHEFEDLVSCWRGHKPLPTFGGRTIDGMWTEARAVAVDTIHTPSDHHTVIARYARKEDTE